MGVDIKGSESVGEVKSIDGPNEFKESAWGYRHQQSLILFLTLTIAYGMRASMGVALVAMTDRSLNDYNINNGINVTNQDNVGRTGDLDVNTSLINQSHIEANAENSTFQGILHALMLTPPYPTFDWNKKIQDIVISSFFFGYMSLQLPAGQLAHRFGAKTLLTVAMTINCIIAALFPYAAYYGGWICTVVFRILQGFSQAFIVPSIHTFYGKWAPMNERGRLMSLTYGGVALGTVIGLPITGFISSSALGWPGLFRLFAIMSGIIAGVIWWFVADSPARHPNITFAERIYIDGGLGQKPGYEKIRQTIPWLQILKTPGVYAIIAAHTGYSWGQIVFYSEVPAYMDKVMGVNIKANGLLTALPFVIMWFANFFFSWLTDLLIVKKIMTPTNVRKFANSIGSILPAIWLVALAYAPKNLYIVECLLILICAFKVAAHMGFQINHIDVSPNFGGTLMSMSNFASNAIASLAPITTAFILTDVKSQYLWRRVFFLAAGLYFFTNLIYIMFGTAEVAEWNEHKTKTDEKIKPEENVPMLMKETEKV